MSYNLEGVDKLQLRPDTIAKIFQRTITTWNDPAIAADNPGVTLPSTAITVAHRSDGSGTTQNFTKYLVKAAPDDLDAQERFDRRVAGRHPGRQRQRRRGPDHHQRPTAPSATSTSPTRSAAKLTFASVKNKAGKFIEPTARRHTAAGEGIDRQARPDLLRRSTRPAPHAYPITAARPG